MTGLNLPSVCKAISKLLFTCPRPGGEGLGEMSEHTGGFSQPSANPYKEQTILCLEKLRNRARKEKKHVTTEAQLAHGQQLGTEWSENQEPLQTEQPQSPMVIEFPQQPEYNAHAFKHTKQQSGKTTETMTSQADNTDFFVLRAQRHKNPVERPSSRLYQTSKAKRNMSERNSRL